MGADNGTLQQGQGTIMMCALILTLAIASELSPISGQITRLVNASRGTQNLESDGSGGPAGSVSGDFRSIVSHVVLLSLSRMAMQQFHMGQLVVDPITSISSAVFQYVQRISEIMFVGIIVSCVLLTSASFCSSLIAEAMHQVPLKGQKSAPVEDETETTNGAGVLSSSSTVIMGKQLDSLMVNLQRTFAETVANILPDGESRRMAVFLGLCLLPSTSVARLDEAGGDQQDTGTIDSSSIESFFLMFDASSSSAKNKTSTKWRTYANLIARIWVTGISMAWINTTLGFILPPVQMRPGRSSFSVTISIVSTVCLSVLTKSLNTTFSGLTVFQNYIEWNVASSTTAYIEVALSSSLSSPLAPTTLLLTGLVFYTVNEMYKETIRIEMCERTRGKGALSPGAHSVQSGLSSTLQTLHSISLIMVTNSLVSYAMHVVSPVSSGNGRADTASGLATVVSGMVAARTIMRLVTWASASVTSGSQE
jgi:hypothetical protein